MTSTPRHVFLAAALLVLGLCWSISASEEEAALPPGFVTRFVTPKANLSFEKLVGRWYVAEHVLPLAPRNGSARVCLILDFHYNDNDTLVVEPISLLHGERASPTYTFPVNDNGVWDQIRFGVSINSYVVVDLSEDNRYVSVATCWNRNTKTCGAFVLVRHIEDASRHEELTELHRRLAHAGVDAANDGLVSDIEPCRANATASPDLTAENGNSTPHTK